MKFRLPVILVAKGRWKQMMPYSISSNVLNALYDLSNDPMRCTIYLGIIRKGD
jgi:hypothetical protein